jgi:hypothetical protein
MIELVIDQLDVREGPIWLPEGEHHRDLPVTWLTTKACRPPHRVGRPEQVDDLTEAFLFSGWDRRRPVLVGYQDGHGVQLLSGSHRWAAADRAGVAVPVIVVAKRFVEECWGHLGAWQQLMSLGDPVTEGEQP